MGKLADPTTQEPHRPVLTNKGEERGGTVWSETGDLEPEELKVDSSQEDDFDAAKPATRLLSFTCVNVNKLSTKLNYRVVPGKAVFTQ